MFGSPMKHLRYAVFLALLLSGCYTGVKHVSGRAFEREFTKSQTIHMEQYRYTGESNGSVCISRFIWWPSWWYYGKYRWQTLLTETNQLTADFLQAVRQSKPPPPRPPTNWVGKPKAEPVGPANRSQPVRPGTNQPSAGAGSGR
jgi:hypothetical protein